MQDWIRTVSRYDSYLAKEGKGIKIKLGNFDCQLLVDLDGVPIFKNDGCKCCEVNFELR